MTSASASRTAAARSDREIVLSRVIEAPRELVFDLWTDPEEIVLWWGPRGFTTTSRGMEARPGGMWRFTMHGPDGRDYENQIEYLEVKRPERIVYRHVPVAGIEPVHIESVVEFEKAGPGGGHTLLTLRMNFATADAKQFTIQKYGALEGGKQTLARLAERAAFKTARTGAGDPPFSIGRVFATTPEKMFELWTRREHLERWFGPKGVKITRAEMDLRPGGRFLYCMRTADGHEHWGRWVFRELSPPERLVSVVSFAVAQGNAVRSFFDENWPLETLSVVTFVPHAGIGGGTLVTVTWSALNATDTERRTFTAGHGSMREGWGGTLDRLAEYLPNADE